MYSKQFDNLIIEISRTFSVTRSQAKKILLKMITLDKEELTKVSDNIKKLRSQLIQCSTCQAIILSTEDCPFEDPLRDQDTLCVVASQSVLENMENNNFYKGLYFVLNSEVTKQKDINNIGIDKILKIIDTFPIKEVILATSPNFDGEMTATYITETIGSKVKISRLGYGLSFGSNLDYANPNTLEYAFKNRKEKKKDE